MNYQHLNNNCKILNNSSIDNDYDNRDIYPNYFHEDNDTCPICGNILSLDGQCCKSENVLNH